MKIKNVVGFMLANDAQVMVPGDQWWPTDALVYVCRNIDVARQIMNVSHGALNDGRPWTTIYRVHADELECSAVSGDILWIADARRIIVDRPVMYYNPSRQPGEQKRLVRGAQTGPGICNFINKQRRR